VQENQPMEEKEPFSKDFLEAANQQSVDADRRNKRLVDDDKQNKYKWYYIIPFILKSWVNRKS
jgi:hypothetical protein